MPNSETRVPIRYCDEVLLEENATRGFLRCTMGLGKDIFVDQLQLGAIDPSQTVAAIHECPFAFFPQMQYDAKELLIKELVNQGYEKEKWVELRRQEAPSPSMAVRFNQVKQEEAENARLVEETRGRELRFGDVVQLQHVWSREWVSVLREPAELDRQAMTISLTPHAGKDSWFRILPRGKVTQRGDGVVDLGAFTLVSVSLAGLYLAVNSANPMLTSSTPQDRAVLPYAHISKRFQIQLGEPQANLLVRSFRRGGAAGSERSLPRTSGQAGAVDAGGASSRAAVGGSDVVVLRHVEANAVLVVERGADGRREVHFMPLGGAQGDPGSKAYFRLERLATKHGGEALWDRGEEVVLRHVTSGMVLSSADASLEAPSALGVAEALPSSGGSASERASFVWTLEGVDARTEQKTEGRRVLVDGALVWLGRKGRGKREGQGGRPGEGALEGLTRLASQTSQGGGGHRRRSLASVHYELSRLQSGGTDEAAGRQGGEEEGSVWVAAGEEERHVGAKTLLAAQCEAGASFKHTLRVEVVEAEAVRRVVDCGAAVRRVGGLVEVLEGLEAVKAHRNKDGSVNAAQRERSVQEHATAQVAMAYSARLRPLVEKFTEWCCPGGEEGGPDAAGQHLLRQQGALEGVCRVLTVLLQRLEVPVDMVENGSLGEELRALVRGCYALLRLLMVKCHANRRALLPHVPVIQQHLGADVLAREALLELLRGPAEVLVGLRDDFFQHCVRLLKQRRSPDIAKLLAATCADGEGNAVRQNQDRVLTMVFEAAPELLPAVRHSLPTLQSDPFTANIHLSDRMLSSYDRFEVPALDLTSQGDDLLLSGPEMHDAGILFFQYYLAMLELMTAACAKRNWRVATHLMLNAGEIACGYNDLLFLVKHEAMPHVLRAQAAALMSTLYVDRFPHIKVNPVTLTRVWTKLHEGVPDEKIKQHDPFASLPKDLRPPASMREMKEVLLVQLDRCSNVDLEETGRTLFTLKLAQLVRAMVTLGGYHVYDEVRRVKELDGEQTRPLHAVLCALLDGRTDRVSMEAGHAEAERARMASTPRTATLRELKVVICEVLEALWQCRTDARVTQFLDKFEDIVQDRVGPSLFVSVTQGAEKLRQKAMLTSVVPGVDGQGIPGMDDLELPLRYAREVETWRERPLWDAASIFNLADNLFSREQFGKEVVSSAPDAEPRGNLTPMTRILLDLVRYPDERLVHKGLRLLVMHFDQPAALLGALGRVNLVVQRPGAKMWYRLRADATELLQAAPWILRDDVERKREALITCGKLLVRWADVLTPRSAGGLDADAQEEEELALAKKMMMSLELHERAMELLALPLRRIFSKQPGELDAAVDGDRRDLLSKAHEFVQRLCVDNPAAQAFFFRHREVLVPHVGISGVDAPSTLAALLRDNLALLLQEGPAWIDLIFKLMAQFQTRRARWLRAVEAMVAVRGKPIKAHQAAVARHLAEQAGDPSLLMKTPREWDARIEYMVRDDLNANKSTSRLEYHLVAVGLLAECAAGNNPAVEIQVAALLSVEEMLDAFVDLDVRKSDGKVLTLPMTSSRQVKGALLKLLTRAYLHSKLAGPRAALAHPLCRVWFATSKGRGAEEREESMMSGVLQDLRELQVALEMQQAGQLVDQQQELKALQTYVESAVFPMLEAYFQLHYTPGQVPGGPDLYLTEEMFDVLDRMLAAVEGARGAAVMRLLEIIGGKCQARAERVQMLRYANAGSFGAEVGVDAQAVHKELMLTGFKALALHLGRCVGLRSRARLEADGGVRGLAELLSQEGEVPLYREQVKLDEDSQQYRKENPSYSAVFGHVARWVRARSTEEEGELHALLERLARVAAGAVHVVDRQDKWEPVGRRGAAWTAFVEGGAPEKEGPGAEGGKWAAQEGVAASGWVEASVALGQSREARVRAGGLRLLWSLVQGRNRRVQERVRAELEGDGGRWLAAVAKELEEGRARLGEYKWRRKAEEHAEAAAVGGAANFGGAENLRGAAGLPSFGRGCLAGECVRVLGELAHGDGAMQAALAGPLPGGGGSVLGALAGYAGALAGSLGTAQRRGDAEMAEAAGEACRAVGRCLDAGLAGSRGAVQRAGLPGGLLRELCRVEYLPEGAGGAGEGFNGALCRFRVAALGVLRAGAPLASPLGGNGEEEEEEESAWAVALGTAEVGALGAQARTAAMAAGMAAAEERGDGGDDGEGERESLREVLGLSGEAAGAEAAETVMLLRTLEVEGGRVGKRMRGEVAAAMAVVRGTAGLEGMVEREVRCVELVQGGVRRVVMFRAEPAAVEAVGRLSEAKRALESGAGGWQRRRWGGGGGDGGQGQPWHWAALPREGQVWRDARRGERGGHGEGLLREWERLHLDMRAEEMLEGAVGLRGGSARWVRWVRLAVATLPGVPRLLAAVIVLLLHCCYGVPAAGPGEEVYEGRYNASASYGVAALQVVRVWQDGRWGTGPDGAGAWEFSPWALPLLRTLAALHVLATVAAAAQFALLEWPVLYAGASAARRRARRGASGGEEEHSGSVGQEGRWETVQLLWVSPMPHYWLLLCLFAFLGAVHSPFFFLAHLLDWLRSFPGRQLWRAWRVAWRQLWRTALASLILLASAALYAYTYFYVAANTAGRQCRSPWQCTASFVVAALAGDVSVLASEEEEVLVASPLSVEADAWEQFRALFVVVVLVGGFLLQGAVLAQIVEAFAALRAEEALLQQEQEQTCPICRAPRHQPAAGSAGNVHDPVAYLLYIHSVCTRPPASLSPLERHVRERFWVGDHGFLPLHTSSCH